MRCPETENPAPLGGAGVPTVVGFGGLDASDDKRTLLDRQARRICDRLRISFGAARVIAELHFTINGRQA